MRLKALWADKTPLQRTGCLQNNQNTTTTDPKKFDQSGPILGGVAVQFRLNGSETPEPHPHALH